MVEYVLILVVTVTLVLGLGLQLFKPLQFFLKDYMGTYVQCLLETGELPTLGGESRISDDSCFASWEKAKGLAGVAPPGSSSGSGKTPSSSSRSPSDNQDSDSSGSGGRSRGVYAGSNSRGNPFFRPPRQGQQGSDGPGASGGGKKVVIALNDPSAGSRFFRNFESGNQSGMRKESRKVDLMSIPEQERKKLQREEKRSPRTIASGENWAPEKKKIRIQPPKPREVVEKKDEGFNFGNMIRIFFIIAIVVVLLLLLGGQALQLSKSWEK